MQPQGFHTRESNWFFDTWAEQRDEGLTPYILVTAKRLQLSKTAFTIRMGEKLMEAGLGPAGREKFDMDQMSFEIPEFMEKWLKFPEWTPVILDEPNRPAGNRAWHTPANNALAEWVQTRAYEHKPSFFPLPHEHLLDNSVVLVCTSEATLERRGHATIWEYDRDLLNRSGKARTPKRGTISFDKPYDSDWAEYMRRRIEYNQQRGEVLLEKARLLDRKEELVPVFTHNEAVQAIMAHPEDFSVNGKLNAIRVANVIQGFSQYAAQRAVDDVKRILERRDKAEKAA